MNDLVNRLLAYVDTWWKGIVVILAGVLGLIGWLLYQHHTELMEAWLTPTEAALRVDQVPADLEKLTAETSADLVQIWSVDIATNTQRFIGARRHDGERAAIPSPRVLPVFSTTSDVKLLAGVLEGRPMCVELSLAGSPLVRRLAERGMKRGCAVPIPPTGERIVGVIYLAWLGSVNESAELDAGGAAREIARGLVER